MLKALKCRPTKLPTKKLTKKNILEIVDNGLCTACGACQGICPNNAISFQQKDGLFVPVVSNDCNLCGICYEICPGHEVDYNNLNREFFGRVPRDVFIGNYLRIWVGHSTDDLLRYKAASGGIVTSLLILALEEGLIDAVVVLGMDKDNPLLTKSFIARTPEEIISNMGSKYTSGPADSMISEIMENEGRYAVVGLPCHIEALRKAELRIKKLRERIVFHFGLFCQTKISYTGLKFWLQVNKIDPQNVTELSYRGNGWPGGMTVKLKHERNIFYPLSLYWQFVEKFTPMRCTLCTDGLSEFSDISFGDAWLSEFSDDEKGTSIVVVRSQKGNELINLAIRKRKIYGTEATRNMLIRSQKVMIKFKKDGYSYRAKILSCLGRKVPTYTGGFTQKGHGSYVGSMAFYIERYIYHKKVLWPFIYKWMIRVQPVLMKVIRRLRHFIGISLSKMLKPLIIILSKMNNLLLLYLSTSHKKNFEKVKTVLIINQADMLNKGDAAILTGTMKVVNQAFPDAKVVIVSLTPQVDEPRCSVKVVSNYRFLKTGSDLRSALRTVRILGFVILYRLTGSYKIFRLPLFDRLANETFLEYAHADLVIHRGGDNLTEDYGIPYIYFESILIGILMRKPTIILGETIGPFATQAGERLAKTILKNVDVIVTREKLSIKNLNKLEIFKPKIFTLPDIVFVLQPSNKEKLQFLLRSENLEKLKKPVIGISISALIARYAFTGVPEDQKVSHLITAMANIIEYCKEKFGVFFVFIPHVIGKDNDDRIISRQIVDRLEDRNGTYVIQGEYSHEDYRAFLAEYAELFIGARMHANIAAVSVGVPTLALAYSQKTHGIIGEMLGLSDFIVDVRQVCDGDELLVEMISKVDMLWERRSIVKKKLSKRLTKVREKAQMYIKVLRGDLL